MSIKRPDIIAELSCNHLGSLERALALVDAAKYCGADGIKIQCWEPNRMVVDRSYVLPDGPWAGRNLFDLYEEAHTPWDWIPKIFERAKQHNLGRIASVFDTEALRYLQEMDTPCYKIASFELVDLPLIEAVRETGKPIILSTGMADDLEVWQALRVSGMHAQPPRDITLLHCISAYPAPPVTMRLTQIPYMRETFGVPVGLSDHSVGIAAAVAATALGATMIEKHFTLARANGGPDAAFSIEPDELSELVNATQEAHDAMIMIPTTDHDPIEEPQRRLRRSLYWARDIQPGETIQAGDMTTARPAQGLKPCEAHRVLGKTLHGAPIKAGTPVAAWEGIN